MAPPSPPLLLPDPARADGQGRPKAAPSAASVAEPPAAPAGDGLPRLPGPARAALIVGAAMLLAVAAGILLRPPGHIAPFWPANAVLIGLMVRHPGLATRQGWAAAAVASLLAELLAGTGLHAALLISAAQLGGAAAGLLVFRRLPLWARRLRRPAAIATLVLAVAVSSAATALLATAVGPLLDTASAGFGPRFLREAMSQIAILPLILSAPMTRPKLEMPGAGSLLGLLPGLAFAASCLAALVVGGPGAIAIPVPALLWCAMTYSLFATSAFALSFTLWAAFAMAVPALPQDMSPEAAMLSLQIGVTLLILAPITIASATAMREEQLARLRHLAAHDPLTGLLNQRVFRERAQAHLARQAAQEPSALLVIDLDHFKSINDRHGHAAGDEVLLAFAEIARRSFRPRDMLGRIGGEEFAVFLPDCPPRDARARAERLHSLLAQSTVTLADGSKVGVTASIGLVTARRPGTGINPLLLQADMALYRAKAAGRNRIEEHPAA